MWMVGVRIDELCVAICTSSPSTTPESLDGNLLASINGKVPL